ncbi:MAG: CoA transferase [Myxococcales bacterium]|nr:CoA transferase [Myxococcales bacterium]
MGAAMDAPHPDFPFRILDLTRVMAGPWAVQHLADQGASIVKVEPPAGDETRRYQPLVAGVSTYYASANRNKRAIVLDLKTEAGRRVLDALVAWCDALMENFRPGVAERLGFGWDVLKERHPALVYVAIRGFGEGVQGWSQRPGYDLVLQHMGGHTSMTGAPGTPPSKHPSSIADLTTGMVACQALLTALLQRQVTRTGQKVVVNMLQVQAAMLSYHGLRWAVTGEVGGQIGNSHASIVPYDTYRCADGWLVVACPNDGVWRRLQRALDLPDPPEWQTNAQRVARRAEVDGAVRAVLEPLTREEALERLVAADVPAGPVQTPDQTLVHPAVRPAVFDHPQLGRVHAPGPLFRTSSTHTHHRPPPGLGQDTSVVMHALGFSEAEIGALRRAGAFGPASD